jgi:hypothetical protein
MCKLLVAFFLLHPYLLKYIARLLILDIHSSAINNKIMEFYSENQKDDRSQAIENSNTNKEENTAVSLVDNSPEGIEQQGLQEMADNSTETKELLAWQESVGNNATEESMPKEKVVNKTNIPDELLEKMQQLSGFDLSDVRVHYNSKKPLEVGALAYAEGENIYIAAGQEEHLEHELWHVIQQKQGKVSATTEVNGQKVNDESNLEGEADKMGKEVKQQKITPTKELESKDASKESSGLQMMKAKEEVIQRAVPNVKQDKGNVCWAASGYAIHKDKGGRDYANLKAFVDACGTANAIKNYKDNKVTDINEIIGDASNNNLLTGSDSAGTYGKSGLTAKFNKGEPILANIDSEHYIVLISREIRQGTYYITYMDPVDGQQHEAAADEDASSSSKITGIDGRALSVLYYT